MERTTSCRRKLFYHCVRVGSALAALLTLVLPSHAQTDYQLQTGAPTFTTAWPVPFGFVNVANGNLHMEIPLASAPQRGTLGFGAKLTYDSRIWEMSAGVWHPDNVPNSQGGWRFETTGDTGTVTDWVSGNLCDPGPGTITLYGPFFWTEPNGTSHTFNIETQQIGGHSGGGCGINHSTGSSFAMDSSGYYMSVTNYSNVSAVYAPDGTQVYLSKKDTNGNYFSIDGNGNVIDTLGRTVVMTCPHFPHGS